MRISPIKDLSSSRFFKSVECKTNSLLLNNISTDQNRLLSKPAAGSKVQGASERKTGATQQFASVVEFRKKSNESNPTDDIAIASLSQHIKKRHEIYQNAKKIPPIPLITMQERYKVYDHQYTHYATAKEAQQYRCTVKALAEWKFAEAPTVAVIFVVDENFFFYRNEEAKIKQRRKVHHSTFLSGKPVKYAGELLYTKHPKKPGVLQLAGTTIISGHYTPHRDTLLGLLLWFNHHGFALENITAQAYQESTVVAKEYLIRESQALVEKITKLAECKAFDLTTFATLMQYLPDVNFPLYSQDKEGRYKPLYPSQIFSQHCSKSNAKDLAIFFLSHCKLDNCATQALQDLRRWLSVTDDPAKNYTFAIHLIRRKLELALIDVNVPNSQEWLPILAQYGLDDLNQYDSNGMTLLYKACRYKHTTYAKLLVQFNASAIKKSGLCYSAQYDARDPFHSEHYAETPFQAAITSCNLTTVEMLLAAGATTHYSRLLLRNNGLTLLQTVIKKSSNVKLIEIILNAIKEHEPMGAINCYGAEGYTAFHYLFLPCNRYLPGGEKKQILNIMKTCPGIDFSLKTNTSPMRNLKELTELYNDSVGLKILQELDIDNTQHVSFKR